MLKADSKGLLKIIAWSLGLLLVTTVVDAQAPKQSANPAADQALKKAQGMLRQLNEEKTALAAEKVVLQARLEVLEAQVRQLQPLQGEVERQKASAETLRSSNQGLAHQLQQSREQEKTLTHQWQTSEHQAKLLQADNAQLVNVVQERQQREQACVENNRQLVAEGQALLSQLNDKTFWEKLTQAEPFTGIASVGTETLVQEYRYKLEDLKVTPVSAAADTK